MWSWEQKEEANRSFTDLEPAAWFLGLALLGIVETLAQSRRDAHRENIYDNLIGTLLELDGKNKDTLKARYDCESLGIRRDLQVQPTE